MVCTPRSPSRGNTYCQRGFPLGGMLGIPPAGAVEIDYGGGFGKGGNRGFVLQSLYL